MRRLRSVLQAGSPALVAGFGNPCLCLSDQAKKLWEAAPGTVLAVDPNGDVKWASDGQIVPPDLKPPTSIAETLSDRISIDGCRKLLDAIRDCQSSGVSGSIWIEGNETGSATEQVYYAHCAALPGCGSSNCEGITVISLFGTALYRSDTNLHIHPIILENRVRALQETARELGQPLSLDRRAIAHKPKPELLDIEQLIRNAAARCIDVEKSNIPDFEIAFDANMPKVTAVEADWSSLLRQLLISDHYRESDTTETAGSNISISLARKARSFQFTFTREFGRTDISFARQKIEADAGRLGKVQELQIGDDCIRLKLLVAINAGIVAPELQFSEEHIRRLHVAANRNSAQNPIPRTRKIG